MLKMKKPVFRLGFFSMSSAMLLHFLKFRTVLYQADTFTLTNMSPPFKQYYKVNFVYFCVL